MHWLTVRSAVLILCDMLLIVASIAAGAYVRLGPFAGEKLSQGHGLAKAFLIAFVCQLCLYYGDLYDLRAVRDRRELLVRLLQALGGTSLILAALYFWFPSLVIGRGVFVV